MKEIIQQARALDLCDEWYNNMLNNPSLENLCDMYFRGDDWSMEKDFPNLELLRKYNSQIQQYGLFTDHKGILENIPRLAIFGNSDVEIKYTDFAVGQVIVRHNSKVKITASGQAKIFVTILDNAKVEFEEKDSAIVKIYHR